MIARMQIDAGVSPTYYSNCQLCMNRGFHLYVCMEITNVYISDVLLQQQIDPRASVTSTTKLVHNSDIINFFFIFLF